MNTSTKNSTFQLVVLIGAIILAAATRLLPHPPNMTPLAAIALFGGAYFSRSWLAFLAPLAALWISNLILDNVFFSQYYEGFVWFQNWEVYAAIVGIVVLGRVFLKKLTPLKVVGASLAGSLLFFVVTNLVVWATSGLYAFNLAGLTQCFTLALPFFRNAIFGDLFFAIVLFGGFEFVANRFPQLSLSKA